MTKLPLAVVEWYDHKGDDGEPVTLETADTFHKPQLITTIGWILKEDSNGIILVNEYYDDRFRGKTFIDKRMLKKVTPYRLTRPHTKREPKVHIEPSDHNVPS